MKRAELTNNKSASTDNKKHCENSKKFNFVQLYL
jgi:hypothetical protein